MLFRRRKPAGFREKLRELFWPRKGFTRPFRYFQKRLLRLTASPYAVAIGVAIGVCVSWTPFIGFHFILALVLTYLLAGNMAAAALGTAAFGNPLTYPFIWGTTWEVGHVILGRGAKSSGQGIDLPALVEKLKISELWGPVLKPMLVGAVPLALVTGCVMYVVTFQATKAFRDRRRERLMARARARLASSVDTIPTV